MSTTIDVNDEWRLRLAPMNVILERHQLIVPADSKKPDYWDWQTKGYYGSIAQAIKAIPGEIVFGAEFETLAQLNELVTKLADDIQAKMGEGTC